LLAWILETICPAKTPSLFFEGYFYEHISMQLSALIMLDLSMKCTIVEMHFMVM